MGQQSISGKDIEYPRDRQEDKIPLAGEKDERVVKKYPHGYYESIKEGMKHVMIDLGSGCIKAGIGDSKVPQWIIPSVLGRTIGDEKCDLYVGDDAIKRCEKLKSSFPIQHGRMTGIKQIEPLLEYTYNKLGIKPDECPACMTTTFLNPKDESEKLCQLMFEKYLVPGFHFVDQGVLCMYSQGKTTGVVLNVGAGITQTICIYEGYALPHTIRRNNLGGNDITEYLSHLLMSDGHERYQSPKYSTFSSQILSNMMKEEHCYVSMDYEKEIEMCQHGKIESKYQKLPDGVEIELEKERFQVPELLFTPSFGGFEYCGIHEVVYNSIMRCDMDIRRDMYPNIILAGGSTLFPGISERLQLEVQRLAPEKVRVKKKKYEDTKVVVNAPEDRGISSFKGMTVVCNLNTSSGFWMCKKAYEENGPSLVHRKFAI